MAINFDSDTNQVNITVPSPITVTVSEKGRKGDTGDTGPIGPEGPQGVQGIQGPVGAGVPAGGVADQIIVKQSATDYDTAWDYIQTLTENVKNVTVGTLVKGTPVHVTGSTGNTVEVIAADAATNYPAHFILNEDLAPEAEGRAIAIGFINNVDVPNASIYTEGQTVYLGPSGGWVTTKPTGTNAIQNLGVIVKVNTSSNKISGIVLGAGRANDVPNLPTGKFFIGSATNTAESAYTMPTADGTANYVLATDGSGNVSFTGGNNIPALLNEINQRQFADASLLNVIGTNTTNITNLTNTVNALDTDDIPEGAANLYYTDARVSANSAVAANTAKVTFPGFGTTAGTALEGDTTTITTAQANAIVANTAKVSFPGFGTTAGTALEGNTALFDGNYASLSNIPSTFTPSAHTQAWSTITSTPTTIAGYGITDAFNGQYSSLSGIPSTFTPSAHTHTASEITDFDTEVSNNTSVAANTAKVGYTDAAVDLRIAAASIGDLSDVPASIGTAGQVLAVNAGATALEYVAQTGGGAVSIDDLTDVDTSTVAPSTGQALVWDGTQWEPGTVSGGGSSLWTASGSDIYYTTGNVGIGTATPAEALDVSGKVDINDGSNNVLISTGNSTITASNTVAVGYQALTALTTGAQNTAVGYQAGLATVSNANGTFLGYQAGSSSTGDSNTLIGSTAGSNITTGFGHTVVGQNAGAGLTTTRDSVAIGRGAMQYANSERAVAVGYNAGTNGGEKSTNVGWESGKLNSGTFCVNIGASAGSTNTTTNSTVSIGASSNSSKGGTISNAVAIGTNSTSRNNTVTVGASAGNNTSTSSVFLGYAAGSQETNSNRLYIENSNSTTPLIYGEFDNDIVRVNGTLQVNDPSSTGYAFPTATGTLGQVLEVNASGDLVFATPSAGGSGGLGTADQTLTGDRLIDTNGYNLAIELDPTGTADTFTIHDGTHDLFQVDTSTTGTLFSVNDVSGLPKLEVDEDEGVIAKSIKVDDNALTAAGQYGKGAEIWYQGTSTPTAGSVYYLDSSGNWANTDASAVATAKGMLSVSAGADSDVDGMVIKGFVYVGTDPGGNVGDVVYLSETATQLTTTAPTTASAVVRVCGYKVGTNIVYFDPSKDWIELS